MMLELLTFLDWMVFLWFCLCWFGYAIFSHLMAKKAPTLSSSLREVRRGWMDHMLTREVRIADVTSLGILQRNVTFFASTTMFVLAGLLTVLGATEQVIDLFNTLPFAQENTRAEWEIKLLLLVFIFIYAFFKFSWSVRQYNFAVVMVGAAPDKNANANEKQHFVDHANQILTRANNSFAAGLRAYSFAMAVLAWFVQSWLFALACIWVVAVLYRREFRSHTLNALQYTRWEHQE